MRSVKIATLLFNEKEPIIAAKMALMEGTITGLLDCQKTLFKLLEEWLSERVESSSLNQKVNPEKKVVQAASFAGAAKSAIPVLATKQQLIVPNRTNQPVRKKSKSEYDLDLDSSENESDSWEQSKEDKRREKLRERNKKNNEEKKKEQVNAEKSSDGAKKTKKSSPVQWSSVLANLEMMGIFFVKLLPKCVYCENCKNYHKG